MLGSGRRPSSITSNVNKVVHEILCEIPFNISLDNFIDTLKKGLLNVIITITMPSDATINIYLSVMGDNKSNLAIIFTFFKFNCHYDVEFAEETTYTL